MFGSPNWYRDCLDDLLDEHDLDYDELVTVLAPLGAAIRASCDRMDQLQRTVQNDDERSFYDDVAEGEVDYIEDLLGVSFVVCQRYITKTVSAAKRLQGYARDQGHPLRCLANDERSTHLEGM
jgi:hypothetical protein